MATIEIDGKTLEAEPGQMIIEVADAAGIYIPRFCYHEKLSIAANCRMCLVEVEKAPKPLPACATPIADGMKVFTASELAVEAQKGTMEFLLINHPLDCPVCDQGGECPLQDQALGYGKDISRFAEKKRVVEDKDIGPLIETEMTRCIHCTRCVRFGQEIAGIMELGMTGRGEHSEITTFLGHTVDSEVSGNMVDLCPVGALTNKPYRFTARAWELVSHDGISPHDCVGANINIQTLRSRVKRVLPRTNESVNECWLADRDRYSYEGLNSPDRLIAPLVKRDGQWNETDWKSALEQAVSSLKQVINTHGADQLGALASPTSTLEEFYLLQKLVRGLGSNNVDHRLRQQDFSDDDAKVMRPWLGCRIEEIERAKAILLVGSNIRKDQPLLGLRVRKAALNGANVMAINTLDYDFNFELSHKVIARPTELAHELAAVVESISNGSDVPPAITTWSASNQTEKVQAIGQALMQAEGDVLIILGSAANSHTQASVLRALAQVLAQRTKAKWGCVSEGNGTAGWVAGCVPHRAGADTVIEEPGRNALDMVRQPLRAYLLLSVEPSLDCIDGHAASLAMEGADCVVALSAFDIRDQVSADVLLPIAPFSETAGTFVNCEGRAQNVAAAVAPLGEARPAWKVLRVLGNLFDIQGFDYITAEQVREEVNWQAPTHFDIENVLQLSAPSKNTEANTGLERISDVPLYRVDGLVRRADALQATTDTPPAMAWMEIGQAQRIGLQDGDRVSVRANGGESRLTVKIDSRVPTGCVYIPSGYEQTVQLGSTPVVKVVKE
ncbi:MAG: NADH-quinone oxidoreductase subunit NuoG [Arenicellales bacterium]|nr:NADH-quinone oxidoreductase subunit NuoG [Arenicellales bacterium]